MEDDIKATFQVTQKTFEDNLIAAQDAAKKAQDSEQALQTKLAEEQQKARDDQEIFDLEKQNL